MDEHVGMLRLMLDLHAGMSPTITAIVDPTVSPQVVADFITRDIHEAIRRHIGTYTDNTVDGIRVTVHPATGIIKTQAEERADFKSQLEAIHVSLRHADEKRHIATMEHPDNGKRGFWHVKGIRHNCIVKNVSSAQEAIDKASEMVGSWESPEASFIGEEMPDVF